MKYIKTFEDKSWWNHSFSINDIKNWVKNKIEGDPPPTPAPRKEPEAPFQFNKMIESTIQNVIRMLRDYGYNDADVNTIWSNDIYNFQLYIKLKEKIGEENAKLLNRTMRDTIYNISHDNTQEG